MGCNCSSRANKFVVTNAAGTCLLTDGNGNCLVYKTTSQAYGAAKTAGLSGYQVRPR